MADAIGVLLRPASVAIAGVSADASKHGSRVLANLRKLGYSGAVHGVNPRGGVVHGIRTVPSLLDCGTVPDVVVAAVPAAAITGLVQQAGALGSKVVVLFGSGFAETGPEGSRAQRRLLDCARESGVRLLGPNSGGVIAPENGVALSFLTCLDRPASAIRPGPVALVTQSGGTGSYLHNLAAARGSGLKASISTGNEADITIAEAIEAFAGLDGVGAIAVVMETVRAGEKFVRAVQSAHRAGRPVVLCRLGRSGRGRELMRSHTGALATEQRVLDGVCDALGLTLTATPGELLDVAEVAARARLPGGPRVGVVTHSGGMAILCSDLAADEGIVLPKPAQSLAGRVRRYLQHGSASNPVDLGAIIGGPHRFVDVVREFRDSGFYDVILAVTTPHPPAHTEARAVALASLACDGHAVGLVNLWMAGDLGADGLALLRRSGAAVTEEPRAALRALGGLIRLGARREDMAADLGLRDPGSAAEAWCGAMRDAPAPRPGGTCSEHAVKQWLRQIGLPVVTGERARTAVAAREAAERIGYPVVVKANATDLAHKSRIGGVRLRLQTPDQVEQAFREVGQAVAARAPGAADDGVLVERYCPGIEVIVGCVRDRTFGPVVAVGPGGVDVEARDGLAMAPAPVSARQALRMLIAVPPRGSAALQYGGRLPDTESLARIISVISSYFAALPGHLAELEVNPLTWSDEGGWQVVDALARLGGNGAARSAGQQPVTGDLP